MAIRICIASAFLFTGMSLFNIHVFGVEPTEDMRASARSSPTRKRLSQNATSRVSAWRLRFTGLRRLYRTCVPVVGKKTT